MTSTLPIKDALGVTRNMVMASDAVGEFPKHLAVTTEDRFFATFSDFNTTTDWEIYQSGSGITINGPLGGGAAGAAPYLSVNSGVTANAKTVVMTRDVYRAPTEVRVGVSASQRIINNSMSFGFLECDASGALITNTVYNTAVQMLNARNGALLELSGVTATNGFILCRQGGGGVDSVSAAFTGFTTAATGTTPNFVISDYLSLAIERDRVTARGYDANILTNSGTQFSRDMNVPNPTKFYRFAMIFENGAVAPVTATDWRIHFVSILDATRFDVSPRHAGGLDASRAFPVNVVNTAAISGSVTATPVTPTEHALPNSAASTNPTLVKSTTGRIVSLLAFNASASTKWIKLYKKATAPIAGTDVPFMTVKVPAGETISLDCGCAGVTFATGLGYCITGAAADLDTTAVAVGDVKLHIGFI